MSKKPVGYFVWTRRNGRLSPRKYGEDFHRAGRKDGTEYDHDAPPAYPLTEAEWGMSLDELARRYPHG